MRVCLAYFRVAQPMVYSSLSRVKLLLVRYQGSAGNTQYCSSSNLGQAHCSAGCEALCLVVSMLVATYGALTCFECQGCFCCYKSASAGLASGYCRELPGTAPATGQGGEMAAKVCYDLPLLHHQQADPTETRLWCDIVNHCSNPRRQVHDCSYS